MFKFLTAVAFILWLAMSTTAGVIFGNALLLSNPEKCVSPPAPDRYGMREYVLDSECFSLPEAIAAGFGISVLAAGVLVGVGALGFLAMGKAQEMDQERTIRSGRVEQQDGSLSTLSEERTHED